MRLYDFPDLSNCIIDYHVDMRAPDARYPARPVPSHRYMRMMQPFSERNQNDISSALAIFDAHAPNSISEPAGQNQYMKFLRQYTSVVMIAYVLWFHEGLSLWWASVVLFSTWLMIMNIFGKRMFLITSLKLCIVFAFVHQQHVCTRMISVHMVFISWFLLSESANLYWWRRCLQWYTRLVALTYMATVVRAT